jgi:DNA invertase Pin-like site-specific DNA recombinase
MEALDAAGACFVSVTRAFNTTTSMGRLTLNVQLSFAQFEREVTGERIRDKVAAPKAKGMWMGGPPPLGYDPSGRSLVVNAAEAESVRFIFKRFVELGSVLSAVRHAPRLRASGDRTAVAQSTNSSLAARKPNHLTWKIGAETRGEKDQFTRRENRPARSPRTSPLENRRKSGEFSHPQRRQLQH